MGSGFSVSTSLLTGKSGHAGAGFLVYAGFSAGRPAVQIHASWPSADGQEAWIWVRGSEFSVSTSLLTGNSGPDTDHFLVYAGDFGLGL